MRGYQVVCLRLSVVIGMVVGGASAAGAQDSLQRVRDLYASAAYEDALSTAGRLAPADHATTDPQILQYRVFCLVALGRAQEAEQEVEAVLASNPRYRPEASEASPRIQELFARVRRRVGPARVQQLYLAGKASMDLKDRDAAIARFEEMVGLAEDPDVRADAHVGELRLLGAGFLDLSRAMPVKAQPAATAERGGGASPRQPGAGVVPPVAVREKLPVWSPPDVTSRAREFRGSVRVQISSTGNVVSAELVDSVHPAYDTLLLRAARDWMYTPARWNGNAVASEKTVEVLLKPQQR
jgi:tetratricopeptide (TPR) repeat protein